MEGQTEKEREREEGGGERETRGNSLLLTELNRIIEEMSEHE